MRTRGRVPAVGALLAAAAVVVGLVVVGLHDAHHYSPFQQRIWKKHTQYCVKSPRARMVHDLLANRLKPGMPMRKVRALLGPADGEYPDEWTYYVNKEPSLTDEGCVLLSLRTDGKRLIHAGLDYNSG